ncbi:hypothetical protein L1987_78847 [Smallanthus sonchifolius]|uniref:Uncharacterized protein n=1 Tax=Smallanthus sonchifolius TaxID=185202 RepID=A0ACB8ZIA7_9ASTR|nr:hypothetical protein L1987_78847 [Smallanthus sonchifolius]
MPILIQEEELNHSEQRDGDIEEGEFWVPTKNAQARVGDRAEKVIREFPVQSPAWRMECGMSKAISENTNGDGVIQETLLEEEELNGAIPTMLGATDMNNETARGVVNADGIEDRRNINLNENVRDNNLGGATPDDGPFLN